MPLSTTDASIYNRINYYRNVAPVKNLDYLTATNNYNAYRQDFLPTRALAQFYHNLYHASQPSTTVATTNKFKIIHKHKESWLDYLNPFDCDTEYSDRDADDDYDDDYYGSTSSERLTKRKFLKLYKLKKKKKKKKIILFKILIAIIVFIAVKALLEKLYYYFPTLIAYAGGRDELFHDGEHEIDRNVDLTKTRDDDNVNNNAEHRSMSSFGRRQIDLRRHHRMS